MWGTDADSCGRDPRVAFLALRHWRSLADPYALIQTVDSVCGAIAGLDRKAVEWQLIDSSSEGMMVVLNPLSSRTCELAAIVR